MSTLPLEDNGIMATSRSQSSSVSKHHPFCGTRFPRSFQVAHSAQHSNERQNELCASPSRAAKEPSIDSDLGATSDVEMALLQTVPCSDPKNANHLAAVALLILEPWQEVHCNATLEPS